MSGDWWQTCGGIQEVLREEIKIRDDRIKELEAKVRELEEYKWMYEELCK